MLYVLQDHVRFQCQKMTCYGTSLADKNPRSRQDLAMQLVQTDYYENNHRDAHDKRVV